MKTLTSLLAGVAVFLILFACQPTSKAFSTVRGTNTYSVHNLKVFKLSFPDVPQPEKKKLRHKIHHKVHKLYSDIDAKAVVLARTLIGRPYQWGAVGPYSFDCSGLVRYVWAKLGVNIPHSTYSQWRYGVPVAYDQLREGDTVFFNGLSHEAMYAGDGYVIESPHTGATVRIRPLSSADTFYGARRLR